MFKRIRIRSRRQIRPIIFAVFALLIALSTPLAAEEDDVLPPGTYRLEMIMVSTMKIPFFGLSKSASKSVSLVEIRSDGNTLTQSHKVCDFRVLEDSKMIKMVFPEKFIAALGNHTYPIQLEKDARGWQYRADLGVERIGYRNNGAEDNLPSKIDDPAVFDWDGDGHPGATLQLTVPLLPSGELYVVQRGQSILTGHVVQPGRVEGSIDVRNFEQRVLGAWPSFLAKSPDIQPDPKESRFFLISLPAGTNCTSLRDKN